MFQGGLDIFSMGFVLSAPVCMRYGAPANPDGDRLGKDRRWQFLYVDAFICPLHHIW